MSRYLWKKGSRQAGSAQAVGDCIEDLRLGNQGVVSPHLVVTEAKNRSSPLHGCFDWNDKRSAHKFRLSQARILMRDIVVEMSEVSHDPVAAFIAIRELPQPARYTSIVAAMSQRELRLSTIATALEELSQWTTRYAHIEEFASCFSAFDDAVEMQALESRRTGVKGVSDDLKKVAARLAKVRKQARQARRGSASQGTTWQR